MPKPGLVLQSAWLNEYRSGDFVALHTDRPDAALTGLIAVRSVRDPVTLCPNLADLSADELVEVALDDPFPAGFDVRLQPGRLLLFDGTRTPHHRRPATGPCSVLTLTFIRR